MKYVLRTEDEGRYIGFAADPTFSHTCKNLFDVSEEYSLFDSPLRAISVGVKHGLLDFYVERIPTTVKELRSLVEQKCYDNEDRDPGRYTSEWSDWLAENKKLEALFERDVFRVFNLTGNPKAYALFNTAKEFGFDWGQLQIITEVERLIETGYLEGTPYKR